MPEAEKAHTSGHHALLPRGFMIMARLFPGLAEELVSGGAIASDVPAESLRYQLGGYRVRFAIGRIALRVFGQRLAWRTKSIAPPPVADTERPAEAA
ncbi:MAG: hypothetical protein H0U55_12275 [Rubrobacteraceae bacterium]|nr:hypothetical protein [Rubrobacteraceae bacterium]